MTRASLWTPGDSPQEGAKATALYISKAASNYVATPLTDAIKIDGSAIDGRAKVTITNWTPLTFVLLVNFNGWRMWVEADKLNLRWWDGVSYGTATKSLPAGHGDTMWLRFLLDPDMVGSTVVELFSSTDGNTWVSLGTQSVPRVAQLVWTSATILQVGSGTEGTFHEAEVRNGIDGPIVAQWDGSVPHEQQVDPQGNVWTVNGTANAWQEV